jgi:hypothetical protein
MAAGIEGTMNRWSPTGAPGTLKGGPDDDPARGLIRLFQRSGRPRKAENPPAGAVLGNITAEQYSENKSLFQNQTVVA